MSVKKIVQASKNNKGKKQVTNSDLKKKGKN